MSTTTATKTATYTSVDVENVVRRVKADLIMLADSTGAWTPSKAADYAHDIELLAKDGYLAWVDVTLFSGSTEMKAVRFNVDTDAAGLTSSRPGGVLWPRVLNPYLRIIISHTKAYDQAAQQDLKGKFRISWVDSTDDTSHSSLSSGGGRDYASNAFGMKRKDWSN